MAVSVNFNPPPAPLGRAGLSLQLAGVQRNPAAAMAARVRNPRPAVAQWPAIMRKGDGSVDEQFRTRTTLFYGGRSRPWKPRQPFGKAPRKGTGRYRAGWLGGVGSITRVTADSATIGVSSAVFPQVKILQGDSTRSIRITDKMRGYVGAQFGVHFRSTTRYIRIEPRAVRINSPGILRRCKRVLNAYVVSAERFEALLGGGAR